MKKTRACHFPEEIKPVYDHKDLLDEAVVEIEGKLMASGLSWTIEYNADDERYYITIE